MKRHNVREVALDMLLQIEQQQAYSNLLLHQTVKKGSLQERDIPLLTELVYGTIQRKNTLDYYLDPFIKKRKKLENWVRMLLRLSLYQMLYLDKVPDRAILYEAVNIAKKRGHQGISSLVNGVLRNIQRQGVGDFSDISSKTEALAIKTSHPLWLIERWVKQYGFEETEKMCHKNLEPARVTVRVNRMRATMEEAFSLLEKEGLAVEKGTLSVDAIHILKGNVVKTNAFQEGIVTIQDESSMLVARAFQLKDEMHVLDCCAAPGGKTTHLAERMNNKGKVLALDLHPHKVKLINDAVNRLGLTIVETRTLDAKKLKDKYESEQFDAILVDAPCTGFGVIRRKPDIKWSKKEEDIEAITAVQLEILASVAPLLKQGGQLIYSTCTIEQKENEQTVEKFLAKFPSFRADPSLQERLPKQLAKKVVNGHVTILPHYFNTDGFFIASLLKK